MYMKDGWTIVSSISRTLILLVVLLSIILLNPENPFYYRALTLWPLMFISHIVVDKLLKTK